MTLGNMRELGARVAPRGWEAQSPFVFSPRVARMPGGYVVRDAKGAPLRFSSAWRASNAAIWSHSLLCSSRRDRSKGLAAFFANCARCSAFE
jgi:hypothetical protein